MLHANTTARIRILAVSMMILSLAAGGCAAFRRAPMQVPAGVQAPADPATRVEAYKKLFPELPILKTGASRLIASKGRLSGKENMQFILLAVDRDNLRLNLFYTVNAKLLDVIVKDGMMTVIFYKAGDFPGAIFQGDIVDSQSPFGRRFGFEPWDLIPVFEVGQLVASGKFEAAGSERRTAFTPAEPSAPGLPQKIELDPATGLPRRAVWSRPVERRWWQLCRKPAGLDVTYQAWNAFKDDRMPQEPAHLMPATFRMLNSNPKVVFDVRIENGYRYSPTVPAAAFVINADYKYYPLERLDEVLQDL